MRTGIRSWGESPSSAIAPVSTVEVGLDHTGTTLCIDEKVAYHCAFDVVWCTQYRAPVITGDVEQRLRAIVVEVVEDKNARLAAMEICPVYAHLVLEVSPKLGIHRLVKAIKARSASVLRDEFSSLRSRLPSLWTNSYLVTTVGRAEISPIIHDYVDAQRTR